MIPPNDSDSPYTAPRTHPLADNQKWPVIARPHDLEEAQALFDLLQEAGFEPVLVDKYAPNRIMDIELTIGDQSALKPWGVAVAEEHLHAVTEWLGGQMALDESDPLLHFSSDDLRKIAAAPLNGNLIEKILAERLLRERGA